ncbi:MAG: hypothetical protein IPJ41_17150 [Phycisphaerales bacterium]|nr:hypothetical protein [Phycisphaerales bacterium]
MNHDMHTTTDAADTRMNELLARARRRAWTGPDHAPRVEEHLKGITMKEQSKPTLTRNAMILIGVGVVATGSLAAAVTRSVLGHHATIVAGDGQQYDVELSETADGASGSFVTDDGAVYDIDMTEQGGQKNVTVDINSPTGGTSTVILDNGASPRITTLPGQTARIEITENKADGQKRNDAESDGGDN